MSNWPSRAPWSPKEVFDRYVQSYTKGEFNVTHTTQQGNSVLTETFVYGGVDFSDIPWIVLGVVLLARRRRRARA